MTNQRDIIVSAVDLISSHGDRIAKRLLIPLLEEAARVVQRLRFRVRECSERLGQPEIDDLRANDDARVRHLVGIAAGVKRCLLRVGPNQTNHDQRENDNHHIPFTAGRTRATCPAPRWSRVTSFVGTGLLRDSAVASSKRGAHVQDFPGLVGGDWNRLGPDTCTHGLACFKEFGDPKRHRAWDQRL